MKVILRGLNNIYEYEEVAGILERKHGGKDSIRVIFDTPKHQDILPEPGTYLVEAYNDGVLGVQYGNWGYVSYIYDGDSGLGSYHQLVFIKE